MDFIIGGRCQGKREYVKEKYGFGDEDFMYAEDIADNDMQGKRCLVGFHLLVRRLLLEGADIEKSVCALLDKNDISVIISDEIGCGIVPADAFEREYREAVGRQSCILAKKAQKVVRVMSGIGVVISQSR
ncbi:MAG: bifunctional adenosylcobinamide kinase/adenosylcobinamide-phosphate guanylyltransferase [Lachnospiraceae bacterium]|nr:bifunctional adenosylcobinamide kinase/adenosylcobinamide-phosphate guanylyltransferase [Lachnospiraceae bacterium]